jgi:L-threonylcarbamoyladenylate synthase
LYRLGSISIEEIESIIGPIQIRNNKESAPNAPGMLSRHYAPKTKNTCWWCWIRIEKISKCKVGLLVFQDTITNLQHVVTEVLSKGDLKEATAHLYAAMHRLDNQN